MNKDTRKQWMAGQEVLAKAVDAINTLIEIKEQEQERYDNLSEGLQSASDNANNGNDVRDSDPEGVLDVLENLLEVEP